MNFAEAFILLRQGKRVRRPKSAGFDWIIPEAHLYMRGNSIYYTSQKGDKGIQASGSIAERHVMADDWYELVDKPTTFSFESRLDCLGICLDEFSQDDVKHEPMLFRCDAATAGRLGGIITRQFINKLPVRFVEDPTFSLDSRVHMLFPGMYPCIPGWHHDDVPRGKDGQPNYDDPEYRSTHIMAIVGDCSKTEFALGKAYFIRPQEGQIWYGEWHKQVEALIETKYLSRYTVNPRYLYKFDDRAWHQGTPATHRGFRLFLRASIGSTRKQANEVRTNSQVYLTDPFHGW